MLFVLDSDLPKYQTDADSNLWFQQHTALGEPRFANGENLEYRRVVGEAHVVYTSSHIIDGVIHNYPIFTLCHLSSELLVPRTLYANYTRPLNSPALLAMSKVQLAVFVDPLIEDDELETFPKPSDYVKKISAVNAGHLTSFLLIRGSKKMVKVTMWILNIVLHWKGRLNYSC